MATTSSPPDPAAATATPRAVHLAAAATAAACFGCYLATLAPGLSFIDAGELAAVAHTFGIAHPTGYPLFTLLAGLWAKLPLGSPIWRLNLLSALWSAAAVGVLVELVFHLTAPAAAAVASRSERRREGRTGRAEPAAATPLAVPLRLAAAVVAAALAGLSRTFWSVSLVVEVYSLHLLLASLVLYALVRALPEGRRPVDGRWLALLALLLGLAFANHLTTVYLVPGLAVAWLWHQGVSAAAWRRLLGAAPFFVAGLLPYLYLPLRAAAAPALNWGDPTTLERFLWHVSGKQYRVWVFSSTEVAGRQLRSFLAAFPGELAWVGLALVPLGLWWCWRHRRRSGAVLVTCFAVTVAYSVNYDIHDLDSYFLLATVSAAILAGLGLVPLLAAPRWRRPALAVGAAAVLAAAALNWPRVSERGNWLVEDYARNMFASLAPNAVVLSYQWDYWVSAAAYLQRVEQLRPDVVVVDTELVRRSHYLTQMGRNHPGVWPLGAPAEAAFQVELHKFEHGLPYDPAVIDRAYWGLLNTLVESSYQAGRPVYLTLEIGPEVGPGFVRIPEGLAFRLYREWELARAPDAVWDDFRYRPFARRSQLVDGVVGAYAGMLTNRGLYLERRGRPDEARSYAARALGFDPAFPTARALAERVAAATVH